MRITNLVRWRRVGWRWVRWFRGVLGNRGGDQKYDQEQDLLFHCLIQSIKRYFLIEVFSSFLLLFTFILVVCCWSVELKLCLTSPSIGGLYTTISGGEADRETSLSRSSTTRGNYTAAR